MAKAGKLYPFFTLLLFVSQSCEVSARSGSLSEVKSNHNAKDESLEVDEAEWLFLSDIFTAPSILESFYSDFISDLTLTPKCTEALKAMKTDQKSLLKMIDAWGKPGTAILQGNVNWIGRSSECRDIQISMINSTSSGKTEQNLVIMEISKVANKATPLEIIYGVCLPKDCNTNDVKEIMETLVAENRTSINVKVTKVVPNGDGDFDWRFYLAVVIFGSLIICVAVGTFIDVYSSYLEPKIERVENGELKGIINQNSSEISERKSYLGKMEEKLSMLGLGGKVLLSFSLKRNIPKLMATKVSEGSVGCLNGIRVMSLGWVILGHTAFYCFMIYPLPFNFNNYKYVMDSYITQFTFQIVDNATFSVDSFFVLSGFLLTYLTLKKLKSVDGKIKPKFWILFYVRRYVRLTPAMMLVILATVGLWKVMGNDSSPLWQPMQTQLKACEKHWWTNLFYINNLFSDNYCIGWTWYLANDFQFYAISPPIIILMYKYPLIGGLSTAALTALSCLAAFIVSYEKNLPPGSTSYMMNFHIADEFNIYSFNTIYIKPWTRFCSYGVGMLLGWFIFTKPPGSFRVPIFVPFVGWILAFFTAFFTLFGLWQIPGGDFPSKTATAFYNSLSRVCFSMSIGWVIWACMFGYGFFINTFLSLNIWLPLTRMTYMTYLIHVLVIGFMYSTADTLFNFTLITFSEYFVSNIVVAYCAAFCLVLLLESPIMGIEKIFIG